MNRLSEFSCMHESYDSWTFLCSFNTWSVFWDLVSSLSRLMPMLMQYRSLLFQTVITRACVHAAKLQVTNWELFPLRSYCNFYKPKSNVKFVVGCGENIYSYILSTVQHRLNLRYVFSKGQRNWCPIVNCAHYPAIHFIDLHSSPVYPLKRITIISILSLAVFIILISP